MGFNCFPSSSSVLPKTLIAFLQLLDLILYGFSALLYRLGHNPSFAADPNPWDYGEMIFSAEPPPSVAATAASVKSRLPAVEYMSLENRRGGAAAAPECVVCLQLLEARDEVRELGNCSHAFHVACIDRWVELGQLSCPMCRSALLPAASGGGPLSFLKRRLRRSV